MKTKLFLLILAIVGCCYTSSGKKPDKIKVKVEAAGIARENTIAALDISSYAVPEGSTVVVRNEPDNTIVNSQLESGNGKTTLYWMIEGKLEGNESRNYSIECVPAKREKVIMDVQQDRSGNLILSRNNKNILQYNTVMARLPHGADPVFSRNGYIHPVWTPDGNVLTSVNPSDHMHHYGIWNPWTSVEYDGLKYDLWNLGDKTGTVRFDTLYQTNTGRLFANIRTGHKHIIFQPQQEQVINTRESLIRIVPKKEVNIMDEELNICVWNYENGNYLWDFVSDLTPATNLPVKMTAYRYAGFALRATGEWTRENCTIITSEGKNRPEIDGTHARWIMATGKSGEGWSGILIMASPENQNFPEPLRIWDEEANGGRGDVMINFAPAKYKDWELQPGKTYRLHYRILTFDGSLSTTEAETTWQDFAHPVKVTLLHRN
ncbi:MAG: PmoA family protein [Tannerellaceae bacterium]|nr:PmoA family protein [Tannerellaceae bacterium]